LNSRFKRHVPDEDKGRAPTFRGWLGELLRFRSFGLGIGKGLALTFKHLPRKPITVQYPEQKLNSSRRLRGYEFVWDSKLCTGCATCAKSCPQGSIKLVTSRNGDSLYYMVQKLEIDLGHCIFCGLCVEACPYQALFLGRGYEKASYSRGRLIVDKEELEAPGKVRSAYARPQLESELPEQDLLIYRPEKGL
jgi:NAD(P)H-quinone oxidoreductase subunit I